jgi:hypothetical protein
MNFYETLTVANFFLTWGVLLLVALALFPDLRQGLAVVRDAVLWCALVVVVAFVAWHGWSHWSAVPPPDADNSRTADPAWRVWHPTSDAVGSLENWPSTLSAGEGGT